MSVRVTPSVQAGDTHPHVHEDAVTFVLEGPEHYARLVLRGANGDEVAMYATGCWSSVEKLPEPDPEPPLLRSGTVVRIPGIDVPYVVDKGLATAGAHATLTFTTVDGRDWSDDRGEPVNAATPLVNAAANDSRLTASIEPYETHVDEGVGPYVSVSVTGPDPESVAKTLARLA